MPKKNQFKLPIEENKVWITAYINREFLHRVEDELKRYGYDIEIYIPTVRVLKKKHKGKDLFEFVPMLFNYGFFRLNYEDACNQDYLMELRFRITAIYAWVKDPASNLANTTRLKKDNTNSYYGIPAAAVAKDKEIADLIKCSETIDIYSADDLARFETGDLITLKGYPFENMPAELLSINKTKKQIRVRLLLEALVKEVTVSYENVFYTIYQGYDDSVGKGDNYDEMQASSSNRRKLDKLLFNQHFSHEEE